jgi:ABC-type antimicrobial peptide transport system permease subunit
MRTARLLKSSLAYYWQTNLVVVLGVATAVAVLAGALLIGASVRGSLRDLVSQRLGNTDHIVTSPGFFREQLAVELGGAPMIVLDGVVEHDLSHRRAGGVKVYGVDERWWQFHGLGKAVLGTPQGREVLLSDGLASELGAQTDDSLLLRIEKHSDIPIESVHGRKDDPGKTIRLTRNFTVSRGTLGEFSLQPQQGVVRAMFISLKLLQRELDQQGKINTVLLAQNSSVSQTQALLREKATLEDLGFKLRTLDGALSLESNSNLISESVATAARKSARTLSLNEMQVFSYLANSIGTSQRSVPYSLVTAVAGEVLYSLGNQTTFQSPIVLNEWAARELNPNPGETIKLEYYVWQEGGRLETRTAEFQFAGVTPIKGLAADRDLVPSYPGITESQHLSDWDPPFPVDLSRVRKQDEDYWDQYRTTPKAFIALQQGQQLWQSRFGNLTSLRITPDKNVELSPELIARYREDLRKELQTTSTALQVVPVRTEGLAASRGATDFGEYFLYFSFFLVVSALLLTALFFKLGIEQRLREIGTLQAIGFAASRIRTLFLAEGLLLAVIGSLLGLVGAIAYAALLMYGLRTWWVDAVGTTSLSLHISWQSLMLGAAGGIAAAVVCIFLTLRRVGRSSTRSLIAGNMGDTDTFRPARSYVFLTAIAATVISLVLLVAGVMKLIPQVAGFFGGGVLLLVAGVCFLSVWLRRRRAGTIRQPGWWAMSQMGFRNTTYRPARTVLCVTLIASAAFIIVAVDAFRRSGAVAHDKASGSGGFPFVAESLVPLVHDINTVEGREWLNLNNTNDDAALKDVRVVSLRMRPGDDASCLNLYQPRNPKIIAPPAALVSENRFSFQNSMANTDEEKQNPWLLLNREFPDGAIPVIGDANSLNYVLHVKVGEDFVMDQARLRVVAALADSIFQSELIMSDKNFVRLFPSEQGYRYFLIDAPQGSDAATVLEDRLSDFGFDAQSTEERLASFHRVENTYLSTFQLLGGLGLALGTLGMAAVLLRNVLERRRELALMRAVGYNSSHFAVMVITENVLMLCLGLVVGFVCALLAITPVLFERGGSGPNISLGLLLLAILLSGATASLVATIAALRSPLLPALRSE